MVIKKSAVGAELTLPTERSKPSERLADYSWMLFALEGWGKTSLANEFPDTLFLKTENGTKAMSVFARDVRSWPQFVGYVDLLQKSDRFSTVAVDTVDLLYRWCTKHICTKLGIDHPSEAPFSQGWDMVSAEFALQCSRLANGRRGTIFISHVKRDSFKTRRGTEENRIVPTMPGGALRVLRPMVDIMGYGHFDDEGNRLLQIRGDDEILAKCRPRDRFWGINTINCGKSPREAYRRILAAWESKRPAGAEAPAEDEKFAEDKKGGVILPKAKKKKIVLVKR